MGWVDNWLVLLPGRQDNELLFLFVLPGLALGLGAWLSSSLHQCLESTVAVDVGLLTPACRVQPPAADWGKMSGIPFFPS
jgi:hypothetical protein